MRVLLLGGNGLLGPHVVRELAADHDLLVTDVVPVDPPPGAGHRTFQVDAGDIDQVRRAAEGCDVIVNCAVQRTDRVAAFRVNTLGTINGLTVAAELGHERFVNTGPRFTIAGPAYLDTDFGLREEIPPHPGTDLYPITKALGFEACRLFAEAHDLHVLTLIVSGFIEPQPPAGWQGDVNPFVVTYADAARAVRGALHADTAVLPSRHEAFWIAVDMPHEQVLTGKARRLLGWEPRDDLSAWWRVAAR
jgi:nucleoside-diphosphate-sugar epimerase